LHPTTKMLRLPRVLNVANRSFVSQSSLVVRSHHCVTNPEQNDKSKPIDLYGFHLSQPTRSVYFLCDENHISYNKFAIDARKGETRNPDFLTKFPMGKVPVINDNGYKLAEGAAILIYLAEKHHLSSWYPACEKNEISALQQRGAINYWLHWHHGNLRCGTLKVLVPNYFPPKNQSKEEVLNKGRKEFARGIKFLETYLNKKFTSAAKEEENKKEGSVFLCSENHPTIADIFLLPEVDQLSERGFNLFDYSPYPNVQKWMKNMQTCLTSYEKNFEGVTKEVKQWSA
jgi:glutathione S-transferase